VAASDEYRTDFNILHDYKRSGFTGEANYAFFNRRRLFRELDRAFEWLGLPEDYQIKEFS
jgi:hypothetical protein